MRADKPRAPTQVGQPTIRVRVASVQALLRAAGWNVAELSRRAHVDHSALSRLLRGDLNPGNRSIAGLLHAFGEKFPQIGFNNLFELGLGTDVPLAAVEDEDADVAVEDEATAGDEAATA